MPNPAQRNQAQHRAVILDRDLTLEDVNAFDGFPEKAAIMDTINNHYNETVINQSDLLNSLLARDNDNAILNTDFDTLTDAIAENEHLFGQFEGTK